MMKFFIGCFLCGMLVLPNAMAYAESCLCVPYIMMNKHERFEVRLYDNRILVVDNKASRGVYWLADSRFLFLTTEPAYPRPYSICAGYCTEGFRSLKLLGEHQQLTDAPKLQPRPTLPSVLRVSP